MISNLQLERIPKVTKIVCSVLAVLMIVNLLSRGYLSQYLAMNVLAVLPPRFQLWQLYTAGLLETDIISGLIHIVVFLYFGMYIEPIWGSKELIKFISVVNLMTYTMIFVNYLLLFVFFGNLSYLMVRMHGFSAVIASLFVVLKQLMPEEEVSFFTLKFRYKYLPSINILISLVFFILLGASCLLTVYGTLFGWVYLRFYQKKGGVRGDLNEYFSFSTFFPESMQPAVQKISNIVYNFLKLIRLCPISSSSSILPTSSSSPTNTFYNQNTADIDRRRALAMKSLEERMNQQIQQQAVEQQQQQSNSPQNPPQLYSYTAGSQSTPPTHNIPIDNPSNSNENQ